jgi:hypothetical protein
MLSEVEDLLRWCLESSLVTLPTKSCLFVDGSNSNNNSNSSGRYNQQQRRNDSLNGKHINNNVEESAATLVDLLCRQPSHIHLGVRAGTPITGADAISGCKDRYDVIPVFDLALYAM